MVEEEGGFLGGGLGGEEGGLGCGGGWRREEGGGEACWVLGGGSVVFVVVGGRHDGDGMVSAKSDRMDISGPDLFFLCFVFRWFFARVSATTTTTRFSDGYSKVLSCPSPFSFSLRERKIEQIERFAAFFVCLSSMSSMAFQSGSPCYCRVVCWQAAPEKPFE